MDLSYSIWDPACILAFYFFSVCLFFFFWYQYIFRLPPDCTGESQRRTSSIGTQSDDQITMQHARIFNSNSSNTDPKDRRQMLNLLDQMGGTMSSNQTNLVVGHSSHSRSSIENTITIGRRKESGRQGTNSHPSLLNASDNVDSAPRGRRLLHKNSNFTLHSSAPSIEGSSTIGTGDSSGIRKHTTETASPRAIPSEPIPITVWFHEIRTSSEDVVFDHKLIPGIQEGDICELTPFQRTATTKRKKLVFKVKSKGNSNDSANPTPTSEGFNNSAPDAGMFTADGSSNLNAGKQPSPIILPSNASSAAPSGGASTSISTPQVKSSFQVSLLANPLQNLMDLPPRSLAHIQVVDPKSVEVDSVEIFIKDVSLSRDSMWTFSSQLVGTCCYTEKRLTYLNNRCGIVKCIYKNGKKVFSGYISSKTNVIFRSESSKLTFLVQLAREMWHFEETGEILFHKLVNTLFPKIFQKWRNKATHHSITIVLFTSMDITSVPWTSLGQGERPSNRRDFFRVVVDQVNIFHWDRIMANLRLEFANFKRDIMLHQEGNSSNFSLEGDSLPSVKGNLLEAINLGLTLVTDRFRNTDLKHSLNHFVVVTPGTGLFDVDYNLMVETSKKMLNIDAGLDIVCLSQPPLHIVPLFRYKDPNKGGGEVAHCVPNWCDISFFKDSAIKSSQWIPRCKIYELQMMGVMENEVNGLEIERFKLNKGSMSVFDAMKSYDENVFGTARKIEKMAIKPITANTTSTPRAASLNQQNSSTEHVQTTQHVGRKNEVNGLGKVDKKDEEKSLHEFEKEEPVELNIAKNDAKPSTQTKRSLSASSSILPSFGLSSLSLMWNRNTRSTSAAKTVDVSTNAVGTVTNTGTGGVDSTALNTLYSLKNMKKSDTVTVNPPSSNSTVLSPAPTNRSDTTTPISKHSFTPVVKSSREFAARDIPNEGSIEPTALEKSLGTSPSKIVQQESNQGAKPELNKDITQDTKQGIQQESQKSLLENQKNSNDEHMDDVKNKTPTDLLWTVVSNPSKEMHSDILDFLRQSRWNGVFPPNIKRKLVKWRSFQSPAALPIFTSVFPTGRELRLNYRFQTYDVLLSFENDLLETPLDLFRELIQIRLLLGFQVCYGEGVRKAEYERPGGNAECIIKYLPIGATPASCYPSTIYLSLDDEIHRLSCDFAGKLTVQLYRHKTKALNDGQAATLGTVNYKVRPYKPLIRTRYDDEYSTSKIDAIKRKPKKYIWNHFDQFLAGFDESLSEEQKTFHKMKFVIMPAELPKNAFNISNEKLSNEEIRMEGLRKLIAMIERGKYSKVGPQHQTKILRKKEEILSEISFYTGNLYDYLCEEAGDNPNLRTGGTTISSNNSARFSTKEISLPQLAQDLQGQNGLNLVDRTWHFKVHPHCFLGNEFVSWLIENFQDIDSREDATQFGQKLKDMKLFKHVESRHGFLDGYYFYEFEDEYIDKTYTKKSGGWFNKNKAATNNSDKEKVSTLDAALLKSPVQEQSSKFGEESPTSGGSPKNNQPNSEATERRSFHLSTAVQYNVDQLKKSYRPELITVHYDKVHNPEHCYHIRLEWLSTTAKFIDETVTNWTRFCERHALKLVETPWDELCRIPEVNPFHSIVDLSLKLNPWEDAEFKDSKILRENKFYFHLYLLSTSGFLLDNRSPSFLRKDDIDITYSWGKPVFKYAQYIHRTGTYIVELRDNGNLFLAPNNVHLTRQRTMLGAIPDNDINLKLYTHDAQKVMLDFRAKCNDLEMLREIFKQAEDEWNVRLSL